MIVNTIKSRGGRFLKEDSTGLTIVDDAAARNKVSSCFRSFRKQNKSSSANNGANRKRKPDYDLNSSKPLEPQVISSNFGSEIEGPSPNGDEALFQPLDLDPDFLDLDSGSIHLSLSDAEPLDYEEM